MTSRLRRIAADAAVGLLFVLLAILQTWPLVRHLRTAVSDLGDPSINVWILDWDWWATFHRPFSLFNANIFYPAKYALAFSENLYSMAVFLFPLRALGMAPLTAYNVAVLAGFAFSGFGAYLLGRYAAGSRLAGIAGGIFYAFVPFRFLHLPHIQHIWSPFLPLMALALLRFDERPSWRRGWLFGLVFLANGLSNVHWLLFGAFASAVAAIFLAMRRARFLDREYWLPLGGATAAAMLLMAPFLYPYHLASKLYKMTRGAEEARYYSAHWSDWLISPMNTRLYAAFANPLNTEGERWLFPGVLAIGMGVIALVLTPRLRAAVAAQPPLRRERRILRTLDALIVLLGTLAIVGAIAVGKVDWHLFGVRIIKYQGSSSFLMACVILIIVRLSIRYPSAWRGAEEGRTLRDALRGMSPGLLIALIWLIVGLLGSLGMNGAMYETLWDRVTAFRAIRVPARFAMIAYVAMSMLVAYATVAVASLRAVRWQRIAISIAICMAFLLELRVAPVRWLFRIPPPEVYHWLAKAPFRGAVLELPFAQDESEYNYMLFGTAHHRPLINGTSGFVPPEYAKIGEMLKAYPPSPQLMPELARIGVSLIVLHTDYLGPNGGALRQWFLNEMASGRLTFVRRFDEGLHSTMVFALTAVEPQAALMRAPERPDPSGRTPWENARHFLETGEITYQNSPFGHFDYPLPTDMLFGEQTFSGWAFAPDGVAEVNLLFDQHRFKYRASAAPGEDLLRVIKGYPDPMPRWKLTLPARPPGAPAGTDVQVEIVDRKGRKVYLPHRFIDWLDPIKK
jgi:hypothetical protein